MKNKIKWFAGIVIVAVIAVLTTGCATNVATAKSANFDKKPLDLAGAPSYTVLGPVLLEKGWRGILGFSTPSVGPILGIGPISGIDMYLFQSGGITYADLLAKAQEKYPETDAVVDIKVDYSRSAYWIIYSKRINIITGIAIKYSRTEVKSKEVSGNINLTF